jgi:hypothetical protein
LVVIGGTISLSYPFPFITEVYAEPNIILDNNGVPLVYYVEEVNGKLIGYQRNPVTTSLKANKFYEMYKKDNTESSKIYFLNNANWLVNNLVKKRNYALLQYDFPLATYSLNPPWYSAMANGLALQVLVKAHEITHDSKYLIAAKNLLNAFFIEVNDGGITYKDSSNEWWYEEYATNDKNAMVSRVLNGMMYAVLGIYDYYKYTNDADAKLLFDKGVNSIKKEISKYNDNGYSYYDLLGNPAGKYHQIHADLTKQLYILTGEPIFNKYYELWKNYGSLDSNVKQIKMATSKTDLCSDRIDNDGVGSDCSTRNFDITTDNSVDYNKMVSNNARGQEPSFSSPPIIDEGTTDLFALENIAKS